MQLQIGKNLESSLTAWFDAACWSGNIALPLNISWWNIKTADNCRNIDISIHFLCFGLSLEIWKYGRKNAT